MLLHSPKVHVTRWDCIFTLTLNRSDTITIIQCFPILLSVNNENLLNQVHRCKLSEIDANCWQLHIKFNFSRPK